MRKTQYILGIVLAIFAALTLTLLGVFVKLVGDEFPNISILFFRLVFSFFFLLPIISKDKNFTFKVKNPIILSSRIIVGVTAMGFYFWAITLVPLVNVILLINTAPIFVPIFLFLFLGKKTNALVLVGIVISFIGVAMIIGPNLRTFNPYAIIALLSGMGTAISIVLTQLFLIKNKDGTNILLFYYFLFGMIVTFCITTRNWITPTFRQMLNLLGVGIFGVLYQLLITNALRYVSAKVASTLLYLSVVYAGLFGWGIWGHKPTVFSIIGMFITISGAIIVIFFHNTEIQQNLLSKQDVGTVSN